MAPGDTDVGLGPIIAENDKYQKDCASGKRPECPGGAKGAIAFVAETVVTAGIGPEIPALLDGLGWEALAACAQSWLCWSITGAAGGAGASDFVNTPYGPAKQEYTPEALAARDMVENGSPLYKYGTLGNSNVANSQFWSLENPLQNPNYVRNLGLPEQNVAGESPFVIIGHALPDANFITRAAPGVGNINIGGAIEVVFEEFGIHLSAFTMP